MTDPATLVDMFHAPDTFAVVHGGIMIHQVPAVSIEGRTVTIIRDDTEGAPVAFYTTDIDTEEAGGGDTTWWETAAHLRAHVDGLATELGAQPNPTDALTIEALLWATVATIAEKAAG